MTETAIVPSAIPQQAQRQDSLVEQLDDLYVWAIRLGAWDAADWLVQNIAREQYGNKATS